MPLPHIHGIKGNYPYSNEGALNFSNISDLSHISQVYANNTKQLFDWPYYMNIDKGGKTLLINIHTRSSVCNPVAY